MHELSITESLLSTASDYANRNNAKKVLVLNLVIGDLSGIIDESVQFYWDMITLGTICEASVLAFTKIPAKMLCRNCENEFEITDELIPCPKCNSMNLEIIAGKEFLLDSIEIQK